MNYKMRRSAKKWHLQAETLRRAQRNAHLALQRLLAQVDETKRLARRLSNMDEDDYEPEENEAIEGAYADLVSSHEHINTELVSRLCAHLLTQPHEEETV